MPRFNVTCRRFLASVLIVLAPIVLTGCTSLRSIAALAGPPTARPTAVKATSTAEPSATPTLVPPTVITSTPTITLTPSITPVPSITPTLAPTRSPDAITANTVALLARSLTLEADGSPVRGVAVSADGALIASGSVDRLVRIYDGHSGELLHTLEHHRSWVHSVAFSPDGSRLASGGRDRTMQLWDPQTGQRISGARTRGEVVDLAFSPDGTAYAGVGYYSALGEAWSAADAGTLFMLEGHASRLRAVAWLPDSSALVSGDERGLIVLHDAADGAQLDAFTPVAAEIVSLAFSPDGSTLAIGTGGGQAVFWDMEAGQIDASWLPHSGPVTGLAFSPDGSLLVTAGIDKAVRLWDVAGLHGQQTATALAQRLGSLLDHDAPVRDVAFSRDGATLATAGDDGRALVWRLGGG
jgi:WD40 repeat protein